MFELANPWFFIALPIPLLLWFLLPRAKLHLPAALRVPFFKDITEIMNTQPSLSDRFLQIILLLMIWSLLLFALAGPRWVGPPSPVERIGHNILLALDLSGSMELNDMALHGRPVSRLAVVKRAAAQFVNDRKTDRIGLILFGSQAYLQTPLTYDHQSLLMRIDDATVGLAGKTTSIGDALGLAVKRLQDVPKQGRIIILLTDGVNNSGVLAPLKAAELAAMEGIKIYTIGLGANPAPGLAQDLFFGLNPDTELDEETLKKVAQITGGQYFRATDSDSLQRVYQTINQMETVQQEQETIRPQYEYYVWPLALAFLLYGFWLGRQLGLFGRQSSLFLRGEHAS